MKVRLSRDPKRLDARLNELSRELVQAEARATRAQNLRLHLATQRDAIVKTMRGRVADLALTFLMADSRRVAAFREATAEAKHRAMLDMFFSAAEAPDEIAPKPVKSVSSKRRGRPPGSGKKDKNARGKGKGESRVSDVAGASS